MRFYYIRLSARFSIRVLVFFLFVISTAYAQTVPKNKFGLPVVEDYKLYSQLVEKDENNKLVDLEKFIPGIIIDIKYATEDNFTKKVLYKSPKAYLRLPAAKALKKIQDELKKQNLELKIFDAYRPYSVTELMWEYVKDDRYAADPKKGSRHNRGCAVDVTIVDSRTGKEIEMPTNYDNFTQKAHHGYMKLPKKVIMNRVLLKKIMEKNGFESITSEWWHYDFKGWSKYHLMNISFEELELNSR